MAAIEAEGIFQLVQALTRHFIAAVRQPAIGLEQNGRAKELIRIPPVARARCGAARAQDAFVESVQLVALFGALQALLARWRGGYRLQPGADRCVLRVKVREIRDEVLDHVHMRKRGDADIALEVFNCRGAGETIRTVKVHGA